MVREVLPSDGRLLFSDWLMHIALSPSGMLSFNWLDLHNFWSGGTQDFFVSPSGNKYADTMNAVEDKIITGIVKVCKVSDIKCVKDTQRLV